MLSRRLGQQFTHIVKIEKWTRRLEVVELIEICFQLGIEPADFVNKNPATATPPVGNTRDKPRLLFVRNLRDPNRRVKGGKCLGLALCLTLFLRPVSNPVVHRAHTQRPGREQAPKTPATPEHWQLCRRQMQHRDFSWRRPLHDRFSRFTLRVTAGSGNATIS